MNNIKLFRKGRRMKNKMIWTGYCPNCGERVSEDEFKQAYNKNYCFGCFPFSRNYSPKDNKLILNILKGINWDALYKDPKKTH